MCSLVLGDHVFRRLRVDNLRGMDPMTLEINVAEPLRRPPAQLEPATMADLMALTEVEELSSGLSTQIRAFADRVATDAADIPDGEPFVTWLGELRSIGGPGVCTTLRAVVETESVSESRTSASRAAAAELLAEWADVAPEPFELGTGKARVQRASPGVAAGGGIQGRRAVGIFG